MTGPDGTDRDSHAFQPAFSLYFMENIWKKSYKKILTPAGAYNIITQCDEVEKCLTKPRKDVFNRAIFVENSLPRVIRE